MIKPLTSLRFFFALMVFLSHLPNLENKSYEAYKPIYLVFAEGSIGVTFFFILSGFIIALKYQQQIIDKQIAWKTFWLNRFARIYPLHVITLILALPFSYSIFLGDWKNWLSLFIRNLLLIQSFSFDRNVFFSFNMPSWSISDEFFFYLMFPLLAVIYQKTSWGKWLFLLYVSLIPFGIWLAPEGYHHQIFDINPITRMADFMIGILLFQVYKQAKSKAWTKSEKICSVLEVGAFALFLIFFIFHNHVPAQYRYSSYYWPATVSIIFVTAFQRGVVSRWLSHPILVFLGEISFGFYLLHHLVIRYFLFANEQFEIVGHPFVIAILLLAISIFASYVTYRWIELPSNRSIKCWY